MPPARATKDGSICSPSVVSVSCGDSERPRANQSTTSPVAESIAACSPHNNCNSLTNGAQSHCGVVSKGAIQNGVLVQRVKASLE